MYLRPRTLAEALDALSVDGAVALAGGTDVLPALVDRPLPDTVVDLSAVAGLAALDCGPTVSLGAGVTWARIAAAPLPPAFRALQDAAIEVGARQIQNRGTLGGNLCNASPAADGVPPLLCLDARVHLHGREGARVLPLADFLLGNRRTARRPDELLTAVTVDGWSGSNTGSAFLKLGARRHLVISIVMVAAVIETDPDGTIRRAAVAVGAAAPVARRLPALEARLAGRTAVTASRHLVPSDLDGLSPIDDLRATAAYRRDAAASLVCDALDLAAARAGGRDG